MKRRSSLLIFLLVFVGLLVLTIGQNLTRVDVLPTPDVPFYQVFTDFVLLDVSAVRLRSPETGDTFAMAREPTTGVWQAISPEGSLNIETASAIGRTMVLLPYTRTISAPFGDDVETYGFTPEGILSIEIVLINGETHIVAVGYRIATELGYYAFVDDRPELYILARAPIDYLINQLREPPVA